MSWRIEVLHNDKGLAFGKDHACGEFLIIWERPNDPIERKRQDQFGPDPDEVVVDEDRFTNFTTEKAKTLIATHGFTWQELENAWQKKEDKNNAELYNTLRSINKNFEAHND